MQVIESILYRNKARAGSVSILCKLQILYCTETKPERGLYLFYASYRVYIVQKQSQSGVCIYSMQVIESILYRNKARAGSVSILCKLQILYCTETKPERGLYLFYASYRVYIVQKQSQSGVCIYSMQVIESILYRNKARARSVSILCKL